MFGNNVTTLLKHLTGEDGAMSLDLEDEITNDILVAHAGEVRHPRIRADLGLEPLEAPAPAPEAPPDTAAASDDGNDGTAG